LELTEKLLISMAGWPVFKQAQAIHASGRVVEASYEPPLLKGRLAEGGKQFLCGLKLRNSIDVENLCPCRDSRQRGIICAHSVAVGLQVLKPRAARESGVEIENRKSKIENSTTETPQVEIELEGSLRHLEANVRFSYREPGVSNPAAEGAILTELLEAGFRDFKGKAAIQSEDAVVRFFAATLPKWRAKWRVSEGERFQHVTRDLVRIEPQFAIRENSDGWLDVQIHHAAGSEALLSHADLARLLQSGQPHLNLKSGKIAIADPALAADLEEVLRDCNPRQERGGYRVAPEFRGYLETSVAQWKGGVAPEHAKPTPTDLGPLREKLRPYQVEGALWLLERARAGRGGLIADEMGLGKTVQALALIEALGAAEPNRSKGTVLVVCPSSLVWNWRREAEHFLPGLPVLTIDGPDRERKFAAISGHRLVVTSYALLRRDIERYRGLEFAAVILDEAQHIKNPESQNAKSACALRAASRFILTGTPIENSVRDLWSLFEFLLPGYLGTRADFKDRYETPLLAGAGSELWARLSRRIGPYLLRRRKQDVLTDLPDKIEQVLEVELTDQQRATYAKLQEAARAQIDQLRDHGQAGAARMRVLTALLRLRQACCDLRLLGASGEDAVVSAKLGALRELLGEAIDGGHRVLVFSQFTTMLDLIERALVADGAAFCRLDGSTKDRGSVVEKFQGDAAIPVFLISLKAGGVGLNLTAADTVIHFDPWWNPAVEAQATDRAHRIGQKNVVTAIKLIARGTIEERVLELQRRKRAMLESTVDAEAALERMDLDDLAALVA
jgi:superfamily II DNA or RNA helicase